MKSVIKLGGCNGSGKTSAAKAILEITDAQPRKWRGTRKSPNYYHGDYEGHEVLILGSYETACGGMDTISDKHERLDFIKWAVRTAANGGIVFFEGLMTGKTYGAIGEYSDHTFHKDQARWLYAFMDTPFDVCVQRVLQRRAAAGNDAPFDPERTMRSTFTSCQHLLEKLRGERVGRTPIPTHHRTVNLKHKAKPYVLGRTLLDIGVEMVK